MAKRILSIEIEHLNDDDPDTSYLEQDGEEERLQQYKDGHFSYIGIRAKAEVQFSDNGSIQTLESGGLWGIEDDSDEDYLKSVEQEELADLRQTLIDAGFLAEYVDQEIAQQA